MDYIKIGALTFVRNAAAADNRLESAKFYKEKSLLSDALAFDTMTADLYTKSAHEEMREIPSDTPILVYRGDLLHSRFFLQDVSRQGSDTYRISARSAMGVLTTMEHRGGIYTGQTVSEVVKDICGNVPVYVKTAYADIALYGWLPIASARDNLAQVLFAIGAYLGTDMDGVLRVETLWDGAASTITADRMHMGGSVEYGSKVTAVSVTEHGYTPGSEEKELFNGTAQAGDVVTFGEPMHTLTATGFTILDSGANWAKLSAGTGVLTGKVYTHTTRQITEAVSSGAENVKTITDATLVSLVNSHAVVQNLAAYYKCTETIKNDVIAGHEKPGHVVRIYHPYDEQMVQACIAEADTTMSGKLKSELEAAVGFKPPRPESSEYFDTVEVLTAGGIWTVPDGVTSVRAVLIGGGGGGASGCAGGEAAAQEIGEETSTHGDYRTRIRYADPSTAGVGGEPGSGAPGGKVYQASLEVQPGQVIQVSIGKGGSGGAGGAVTEPTAGGSGGDTAFGGLSSAEGVSTDEGFTEQISGVVYAGKGQAGFKGGSGSTQYYDSETGLYVDVPGETLEIGGVTYGPGQNDPLAQEVSQDGPSSTYGRKSAGAFGGFGGGAAYGSNGGDGSDQNYIASVTSSSASARGATGGNGADAQNPTAQTVPGTGGNGGHGGGGAGSAGRAYAENRTMSGGSTASLDVTIATPGQPGQGSDGGDGVDGCVIVYYRTFGVFNYGPIAAREKWYLDSLGRRVVV